MNLLDLCGLYFCVLLGGLDFFMAQEFLDIADIISALQKMRGAGSAEHVRRDRLCNACAPSVLF